MSPISQNPQDTHDHGSRKLSSGGNSAPAPPPRGFIDVRSNSEGCEPVSRREPAPLPKLHSSSSSSKLLSSSGGGSNSSGGGVPSSSKGGSRSSHGKYYKSGARPRDCQGYQINV